MKLLRLLVIVVMGVLALPAYIVGLIINLITSLVLLIKGYMGFAEYWKTIWHVYIKINLKSYAQFVRTGDFNCNLGGEA